MTNTVTPKITTDAEIWFDPAGGTEKPTKVLFSMSQTVDAATYPYGGGGTITRDKPNVELFRDDKCTQPLVFSESQARVTNAELKTVNGDGSTGLIAWIKGTKSSADVGVPTTLKLQLDLLERSERKETDFDTLLKTNTINVVNADAGASQALTIKAAGVATPTLAIGALDNADTRVFSDKPTQVVFAFTEVANDSGTSYDGNGALTLEPKDAKLGLYKDESCTQAVVITDGKATIPSADLKNKVLYWLKAAGDATPAAVKLTLALEPASDPKKFAVQAPITKAIALARVNAVTASLVATIPDALEGAVWFPSPAAVDPPSIALKVTQTQKDDAPYGGDGVLSRDKAGIELYRDKELTKPVPFFGNAVAIPNAELVRDEPLVLYLAGTETVDAVQLTLTLYDPKQRALKIGDPKQVALAVKAVNRVAASIAYGAAAVPGRLAPVSIFITQSNPGAAAYDRSGTLRRASTELALFTDKEPSGAGRDPVFSGTDLTAQLSATELGKRDKVYWLGWQGANPPLSATITGLSLELPASAKPFVVTEPAQLRLAVPSAPLAPIGGSTTVTPKLETEYDLVLLATTDTKPETRTSPVRARFYVDRGTPAVAYSGDATLTRDSDKLRVFLDAECTVELNFSSSNVAVIPNAALLDKDKLYWLVGAAAGKVKLTLAAAKPAEGFASPPPVSVGPAASKDLAVVALDLTVFRDDGEAKPSATSNTVALTKAEQRARGRFVHLQDAAKHGRAKLVLKKLDTGDWPGSADRHELRIAVTASADRIRLYKSENGTDLAAKLDSPAKLDKGAAGSGDTTLWAEGQAVSDDVNDVRIDVGISRSDDSGFQGTKPLLNGDWASMTCVKIVEVKPNAADWKQFVNLPPDLARLVNDNGIEVRKGRNILITARLDPPKANIGVDFMLWGFDGNGDADVGTPRTPRIPDALKAEAGHVTSVSTAAGLASARIKLSRYGGDKFFAVAFLADDAAKGEAELGKKGDTAPDNTKSKQIQVWQKIFYTLSAMRRQGGGGTDYSPRANAATFEATFTPAFIELAKSPGVALTLLPHQATITKDAAANLGTMPNAAERTVDVGLLDTITRVGEAPAQVPKKITAPASATPSLVIDGLYDPADWLVGGSGELWNTTSATKIANIPNNKLALAYEGEAMFRLSADISAIPLGGATLAEVEIRATLKYRLGPSGFTSGTRTFVALRSREQEAVNVVGYDATESCVHTMAHEVGHYIGLTSQKLPDPTQTRNRYWYKGGSSKTVYNFVDPPPPDKVSEATDATAAIGLGGHCKYDRGDYDNGQLSAYKLPGGADPICIMYHALTTPVTVTYCPNCIRVLRGRDLSSPPVNGTDDF